MITIDWANSWIKAIQGVFALCALTIGAVSYFATASDLDTVQNDLNQFKHDVYISLDEAKLEEVEDVLIELELKPEKTDYDNLRIEQKKMQKERILRRLEKSEKIRGAW